MNPHSKSRRRLFLPFFVGLLTLLSINIARGDVLVLKDGRKLTGKVTKKGSVYEIKMKYGSLTFKASEVVEVEMDGKGPAEEKKKPDATPTAKKKIADPVLPKLTDEEKAKVLKHLPSGSLYKESKSYAVASSASKEFTRKYSVLFEQVRKGFYKYFEERGFELERPNYKLEAVIFKDEASFNQFARKFGLGGAAAGFYATSTNQLYLYDSTSSQGAANSQRNLDSFKAHLDKIKKQKKAAEKAKNSAAVRQLGEFYRKELKRYKKFKKEVANFYDDANRSTTIHEAVHQLCYNSELLHVSDLNPEWLTEGLAMLFEDAAVWKGRHVAKGNKLRIENLQRALKKGRTLNLKVMVSSRTQLIARGDPGFAYASSWALIHFFIVGKWRKYKEPFFEYLKAVRKMTRSMNGRKRRSRQESEAAQLKLFIEKFGPINKVEAEFRAYVKKKLIED
ncbi:MAG: DUF1570 domain-containing protein [Planctomycetota bacterium]|nr:DUF1570 domain-containing protein [Planctomycetota bacterium]